MLNASTVVVLAALLIWIGAPVDSMTEVTRLRNALLLAEPVAELEGKSWDVVDYPSGYFVETSLPPEELRAVVKEIAGDSDLEVARQLATHLVQSLRDSGGPVQSIDILFTYQQITRHGAGYCADVVDAFTALALAAGLPVRQWAFSFDGFGGHGHVIVEIRDRGSGSWIALDIFNNVMPVHSLTGVPLSALDTRNLLKRNERLVDFVPIGEGRLGFVHRHKLYEYYRMGLDQWYMWYGNNVISRGDSSLIRAAAPFGHLAQEAVAIATGRYPKIRPLATDGNVELIARMVKLHAALLAAGLVGGLMIALLGIQSMVHIAKKVHHRRASARSA